MYFCFMDDVIFGNLAIMGRIVAIPGQSLMSINALYLDSLRQTCLSRFIRSVHVCTDQFVHTFSCTARSVYLTNLPCEIIDVYVTLFL